MADRKDTYKQLPLLLGRLDVAAVTFGDRRGGKVYGFVPKNRLFGSAAAALRYNPFRGP